MLETSKSDANDAEAFHAQRFIELDQFLDPVTQGALDTLEIGEGHRVLEIAPRSRAMMDWVADRVGNSGHVAGLDINPYFVPDVSTAPVSPSTGKKSKNIRADTPFDFVLARLTLTHVSDAVGRLKEMGTFLSEGGKLLLVDLDFGSFRAVDDDHPNTAEFNNQFELHRAILKNEDYLDINFAGTLPEALAAIGFTQVKAKGHSRIIEGGSADARFWKSRCRMICDAARDFAPDRRDLDADIIEQSFDDPGFRFSTPAYMQVSAVKP